MRRVWLGVAVTALVCAGCSAGDGETMEVTTTDREGRTTVVTQEVTETPEPSAGEDAAPSTATMVNTVLDVPGGSQIAFDLPDTWTVQELGEAVRTDPPDPQAQPPQQWCLVPPTELPPIDGCAGVLIASGPDWVPGHAGAAYAVRQQEGWRSTAGQLPCPFGEDGLPTDTGVATSTPDAAPVTGAPTTMDDAEVDLLVTENDGFPLTSAETEVDGRSVRYETWRASCSLSEGSITPQVWHDLELGVLVRDYIGSAYSVALVGSLREV